jgi:N-acetyl-gamma-glutamyl-phosphate reductase
MSKSNSQHPPPTTARNASAVRGVGILGATGYTGAELVRLICDHPQARLVAISARQYAGEKASEAFLAQKLCSLVFDGADVDPQAWRARGVEVVFACLPHGTFAGLAEGFLRAGITVIDLSADFRLRDQAAYAQHYQWQHPQPELLSQAHYGLCEWATPQATTATRLVANPGCYATAILLGLLPAAEAGWLGDAPVVINAISGVSGAGRSPKLNTHLGEAGNSVGLYKVGQTHQHLGEIGERLAPYQPRLPQLVLNPHLAPMSRGIVASLALPLVRATNEAEARALYQARYQNAAFVRLLEGAQLCETRFVRGSNRCDIAVRVVAEGRMLLVFSAIDNLLKGAAGQAVQNFNLISGFAETLGLPVGGIACI